MDDRYIATFVLHALGDTIGFKNGDWEFNYGLKVVNLNVTLEMLYEFIDLGGINNIRLKGWRVSDDTVLHIAIGNALLEKYNTMYELGEILKKNFIDASRDMKGRHAGLTTLKYIKFLENSGKWNEVPYDVLAGGAGAAMRTPCIGLAYHGEENRDKLIEISIRSSQMTHNSAIGYLGGLTTALFTAYAIENIHINKWPFLLVDLLKSEKILKYIMEKKNDDKYTDYSTFLDYWKRYIELRFVDGKPIKTKVHTNLIYRIKFHYDNFVDPEIEGAIVGESGYGSVIMAYDALLDAGKSWEKLVIYAMIHIGDSDTVGCIAGAWYGAIYGFKNVPGKNMKYLEYKDKLISLGKNIYKKYYLHEDIKLNRIVKKIQNRI